MNKFAITINNNLIEKYKLKSIDDVYEFLKSYNVKPLIISAERNSLNKNYHYHVLSENYDFEIEKQLWADRIYNEIIVNEFSYTEYIKKDGNYKIFNDYVPMIKTDSKSQYSQMVDDIYINNFDSSQIRIKYPTLFVRHFKTIMNMIMNKYD